MSDNAVTINRAWNRSGSFRLTLWLKIIPHMIRSYYCWCCINEPVIINHCVHLKLGHRFHALLKDCFDRDDIVPLKATFNMVNVGKTDSMSMLTVFESRYTQGEGATLVMLAKLLLFSLNQDIHKGRYNIGNVGKTDSMIMLTLFESRYTQKKVQHC